MKETFTWWNMSDSPLVANLPVTVNMYTLRYPAYVPSEKEVLIQIGSIAGTCYTSSMKEDKCIARAFATIKNGHHSPWEHVLITTVSQVDRGVSHALVRHRHTAFQQQSTIYTRFKDKVPVISMPSEDPFTGVAYPEPLPCIKDSVTKSVESYMEATKNGVYPSEARDVLPTCLATDLVITAGMREYMYMIQRRCGPGDSLRMHVWCYKLRRLLEEHYPRITEAFDTWYTRHPL